LLLTDAIAPVIDVDELELASGAGVHPSWPQYSMLIAGDSGPVAGGAAMVAGIGRSFSIVHSVHLFSI
jgi:hypothetical protein